MRDIKFRGKPFEDVDFDFIDVHIKKEDFVYGNLIVDGNQAWIVNGVIESTNDYITLEQWIPVRPETVGQFTGLNDERIPETYEGDIVRITYGDTTVEGVITFTASSFMVCDESDCYELDMYTDIEVIGTIHDKEVK